MDEQQQSDSNDFVRRRTTRLAHPLPSSRLLLEKQFLTLRAYGTRTRDRGLSMQELAKTVGVHESNLSTCNPFFVEVGLIERAEGGYKATPATVAYAEAAEWDEQTALEKLAPAFERSWLWQVIEPRIQFRPIEEDEAIRLLAEKTRASKELKPQVRLLLDYLVSVRLLTRDGNSYRRTEQRGQRAPELQSPSSLPPSPTELPPLRPVSQSAAGGVRFDVSISIDMLELATWSPDRIQSFMTGLAAVIAAKGANQQSSSG